MTTITYDDFKKLVKLLEKEGSGGYLTFRNEASFLQIKTVDRTGREMVIELSDKDYPFMPRVIKTETF